MPLKGGYQSHYVLTTADGHPVPDSPSLPSKYFDELVLGQESQVVPAYVIELDSSPLPQLRFFTPFSSSLPHLHSHREGLLGTERATVSGPGAERERDGDEELERLDDEEKEKKEKKLLNGEMKEDPSVVLLM